MWYIIVKETAMKKNILFIVFFCFLALVIPGSSLFADIGLTGRIDAGMDVFAYLPLMENIAQTEDGDALYALPVIPLLDFGYYGQFSAGLINMGAGIRHFSLVLLNVFWPSVYTEVNLWRFTLHAELGGGGFYLFPIYVIMGPYFVPELSMWFRITKPNQMDHIRIGVGTVTVMSPRGFNKDLFQNFSFQSLSQNALFYLSAKFVFHQPWMMWKRVI